MKKTVRISIVLVLAFSMLIGCGKKQEDTTSNVEKVQEDSSTSKSNKSSEDISEKKQDKQGTSQQKITIGGAAQDAHLIDLGGVAQDKGYFEDELSKIGWEVEYAGFAGGGAEINEALAGKHIEFAIEGNLPAVVAKANELDVRLISITNESSHVGMIVQKDSGIESGKDLEGKKVIVTKGSTGHLYFQHLIDEYNLDLNKIEVINAAADAQATFNSKSADAYIGPYGYLVKMETDEGIGKVVESTLTHEDWAPQNVFVARGDFVLEHPEVAVAVEKAFLRAWQYAKENPDETFKNFAEKSNLEIDVVKDTYGGAEGNFETLSGQINNSSIKKLEDLNAFLLESEITTNSVNINEFIDTSFYAQAKEELGIKE